MRERRPGVWEIRVVVANDLLTGRSVQRSFTVHADRELADEHRRALVERFGVDRSALYCEGARGTVAELLKRFIEAEHQWRPATRSSHTSVVRFLTRDPLGRVGVAALNPLLVEEVLARWRAVGGSTATVWGRWAVLHSCLSWAALRGMVWSNPILGMRSSERPTPRKHLLPGEVSKLLRAVGDQVRAAEVALVADPHNRVRWEGLFVAQQTRLLVRLAADTGARRGELATLRLSDLDGRVLTIERNLSLEVLGPTKTGRSRRMTIGATTAAMLRDHFAEWEQQAGSEACKVTGCSPRTSGGSPTPGLICCRIGSPAPRGGRSSERGAAPVPSQRRHTSRRERGAPQGSGPARATGSGNHAAALRARHSAR